MKDSRLKSLILLTRIGACPPAAIFPYAESRCLSLEPLHGENGQVCSALRAETFRMAARPPYPPPPKKKEKIRALQQHTTNGAERRRFVQCREKMKLGFRRGANSLCGIQHGKNRKSITATNTLVNIKRIMLHCTGGWL